MSGPGSKSISRRALLTGASGAVASSFVARTARAEANQPTPQETHSFGMAIDLDRCMRCQSCVVACAAENNVPPLAPGDGEERLPIHWMDMLVPDPARSPSALGRGPAPIPCMHCERPACVRVCPVGATNRSDDGVVDQIWARCIGCRSCMVACPYGRRYFNWTTPTWPGGDTSSANPDVAMRPAGVVEKCTLCHHRIRDVYLRARIEEEPVADETLRHVPACASACPTRAITFGDFADPDSALSLLAKDPRAVFLLAHLGTGPKVFYLKGRK